MSSTNNTEQRLQVAAKKADREREAAKAMREYEAEKARIDANTTRLRALRLAKEAADAVTAKDVRASAPAKAPAAKKPVAKKKATNGTAARPRSSRAAKSA
jgi:hypothetical protein